MKDAGKDNTVYLRHILDAVARIERYTQDGKERFFADELIQNAVVWNIGVIGEAVRAMSQGLKDVHPDIPWLKIAAMRHRLIHEYFNINLDLVWDVVEKELPILKPKIEDMLSELGSSTR